MKKTHFTLLLLLATALYSFAQTTPAQPPPIVKGDTTIHKDTAWKIGGLINISFGQVSLSNWAAGGENSLSLESLAFLHANYKKGDWLWKNELDLAYGFQELDASTAQKTDDRVELASNAGYKLAKSWYLSILFDFKTQFAPGYNYTVSPNPLISGPFSPAYFLLGTGITYNPNKDLTLYLSPATARLLVVTDQTIANAGTYGNTAAVLGADGNDSIPGKTTLFEFGAYFAGKYSHTIMKNVTAGTELDLFSNYLNDPQDIVVNWNVLIGFKVNKYLSGSINTQLIYDNSVHLPTYITTPTGGIIAGVPSGPRTQFKEVFGIGFNYLFGKK
jgi:hypothetical protein